MIIHDFIAGNEFQYPNLQSEFAYTPSNCNHTFSSNAKRPKGASITSVTRDMNGGEMANHLQVSIEENIQYLHCAIFSDISRVPLYNARNVISYARKGKVEE